MKMMSAMTRCVIKCLGFRHEEVSQPRDDDGIDSELHPLSIPDDYKTLISHCFRIVGLTDEHVSINVHPVGLGPSGLEVYAAFVQVMRRDMPMAAVLSELPQVEKMVDRGIRRSDMPRYSSFAGIRFRSSHDQDSFSTAMH
ncbi:hypothetical protein [Hydrogenophaga sp.]|uniref:hypothetical protein n=1 Tax=Hydrogenophaga sp. TaxID=1904254 RepID=UPI002722D354|nr:hypothetical protein [Hydrogenophaga sp.]MDO9436097.1 hypothetical protein [Hydrogenophaga sp.]